jgi:hypothetical protein
MLHKNFKNVVHFICNVQITCLNLKPPPPPQLCLFVGIVYWQISNVPDDAGELQEEHHVRACDPPGDPQGGDQHHDREEDGPREED